MKDKETRKAVRESYAKVAKTGKSCCSPDSSCCSSSAETARKISKGMGYSDEEMASVPEGANLGLGCGNPVALASLKEGETVLDLGCGAGFDSFLAAQKVGKTGRVIGVDMTPEMLEKARANAGKGGCENVEFRLGEIENIPAADNSVDVVISNCVINLSPDKKRVFSEAFRVVKPGGRLMVSDIVLLKELPDFIRKSAAAYVGCISGALMNDEYLAAIEAAGFQNIKVLNETVFPIDYIQNDPTAKAFIDTMNKPKEEMTEIANSIISIKVEARKTR
ncbi:MAG: arsenite methyltransferase [Planctomycetota bacterium]